MKFTGNNTLQTPRVSQLIYQLSDIVVDSTGLYAVQTRQVIPFTTSLTTTPLFSLVSGMVLDSLGRFVSTYNTGSPFSVSGWIDYATNSRFFSAGQDILSKTPDSTSVTGLLAEFAINCPTSGALDGNVSLKSTRISEAVFFASDFGIRKTETGRIEASHCMFVTNDNMQFYQSYEQLLTGSPLVAFIDTRFPTDVKYYDNDSTSQNNTFNMTYYFDTSYDTVINPFTINRTGLYSSGILQNVPTDLTGFFSGLFEGIWSGNQFLYDTGSVSSMTLGYYLSASDTQGLSYPVSASWIILTNIQPTYLRSEYITGFQLTNSGIYKDPPILTCSGYYYVTGIQQQLSSLLFSTGCTGNMYVTFSGGGGTGASGQMQLQPILFSGVYSNQQQWYNLAYKYVTTSVGTGYVLPPKAYINTGMYGPRCFDVPRSSGYNQAFFSPFDTSGTMDIEAGWFTGVPLCVTGITGNGLTGYFVTGIDVYNIGFGYSDRRPPRLVFVRTGTTMGSTSNASGILFTKQSGSGINPINNWKYEYSIGGGSWITTGNVGSVALPDGNHYLNFRMSISGSDITEPLSGNLTVVLSQGPLVAMTPFLFTKYYTSDPEALKKKDNPAMKFSISSDLSFTLSQSELDMLYSSAGYTDNNWTFTEGDFDF